MASLIPPEIFFGNVQKLLEIWSEKHDLQFDSIIIVNGKASGGNQKTVAILSWFLAGYNLADTILFFTKTQIVIYASERKITFLSNIAEDSNAKKYNLSFHKKEDNSKAAYKKIWETIHQKVAKPKVGMLLTDSRTGAIAEEFDQFVKQQDHEGIQVFNFFNECFQKKLASEIDNLKKSSRVSAYFEDKFIKEVEKVIDSGRRVKHSDLTQKITEIMSNQSELKKLVLKLKDFNLNKDYIEVGPIPSIQSGGNFKHKLFSPSDDSEVKSDCIILGIGSLYRSYNSYVSRTLLIDPTDYQKNTYKKIQTLSKIIIQNLRVGVKISDVYKKAKQFVSEHLGVLNMPKALGFGIGVFIKENTLEITENNDKTISVGNVFLIDVTFTDIKYDSKKGEKTFGVQLIDTVSVQEKGHQVLTSSVSKVLADISYSLDQDDEPKKKELNLQPSNIIEGSRRRRKNETANQRLKSQKERNQHQKKLKLKKLEQLKERINQNFQGDMKKQKMIEVSRLQSYKHKEDLPKDLKKNMIYVDNKSNSILLPIKGAHIPFHIHILKSIVKSDEGKFASLRFNFHLPNGISNLSFPKFNQPTIFVKELVFRSQQISRLAEIQKQVKALQKKVRMEANQKNAKQDIVEQQKININRGKRPILRDLFPRPTVGQKKTKGNLECHLNGFRYTTSKGQSIDIAFSNVKFAFFQPCENQIIAAIHFRLHEPVMVAKKKTEDIQFYSEGGTSAEDVVGRGGRGFGRQDSDDEQRQKDARKKIDRQFIAWTRACSQFIGGQFQFQFPDRNKGFYGTPFKGNCLIQPTKTCLINVTQIPFFVLSIKDIQVACFERMYANLKSFDVTFVNKDYETHIRVNSIPIKDVQRVKDFLDDNGIIFYDLGKSMNWAKFLATIRFDFKKFIEDGGWTAWDIDDDEQNQELMDGDSQFSADQQELEDEEDSEQSDQEQSGSDFDSGDGSDEDSVDEEELQEEGLDWDQMEERAEKQDKERMRRQIEKEKFVSRKRR